MNSKRFFFLVLIVLTTLSCNFITGAGTKHATPTPASMDVISTAVSNPSTQATTIAQATPVFSAITFCEDVTDEGEPVNPMKEFPGGTTKVWAFFTYKNMHNDAVFGRRWLLDGEIWSETPDDTWTGGGSGWSAYSISDSDNVPLSGNFTLTLSVNGQPIQEGSFEVAPPVKPTPVTFPSFGPIQFASQITEDKVPVLATTQFDPGVGEVYAVFPYAGMHTDTAWRREWLFNGKVTAEKDEVWDGKPEGLTYISLYDEKGLSAGEYTLNLYIDQQLVRSARFTVAAAAPPTEEGPANPEDLIDADLMPAWEMLYNAHDKFSFLHETAQFVLDHHIRIRMDESYNGEALASYRYDSTACQPNYVPGEVIVYRQTWNETSWEELAGVLAHELTHARQHYSGESSYRCPGCSVHKEFDAFVAQIYTWYMLGRQDLIEKQIPAWDSSGSFSSDMLWDVVKKTYGDSCPDY
jgi:hypothetical protein